MEVIANISQNTTNLDVIRAWRDPRYRRSLSAEQIQRLPGNPAGPADLTADEVKAAAGLASEEDFFQTTAPQCTLCTFNNWKACGCVAETTSIICTLSSTTCPCQ